MSLTLLRIAATAACICLGTQALVNALELKQLRLDMEAIKAEIDTRNRDVEQLCKEYGLETWLFWFDKRELIPRSAACVVDRKRKKDSLVIIKAGPTNSTFKL